MHKILRAVGASRAGSTIERNFHTTETEFTHLLAGNKKLQKLGRSQSTSHLPKKFACWTPDDFDARFKDYSYLRHPNVDRRGIAETSMERWERSSSQFDELPGIKPISKAAFEISTLPNAPRKETRVLNKNQLTFSNVSYLLSKDIPGYSGGRIDVPIKYNPYDISYIMAKVCNRWVRLFTNDILVRECHDKGVHLAHMEVYSRKLRHSRRYNNGSKISADLALQQKQKEQHQFNLKKSSIGKEEETHLPDIEVNNTPINIDFNSLPTLPSTLR